MSMTDPIADMLTRVRNAQAAKKVSVVMPHSKIKESIAKVLLSEGYISGTKTHDQEGNKKSLEVKLKYFEGKGVIETLQRVSKPSLRTYASTSKVPRVLDGLGIAILSTSKGIISDKKAREQGVGGEVICTVV